MAEYFDLSSQLSATGAVPRLSTTVEGWVGLQRCAG